MTDEMTPEAKLLILIMASHGGMMTKKDAEAEFMRVIELPQPEYDRYIEEAKKKAAIFAQLKRQVDE